MSLKLKTPQSLSEEHNELHAWLEKAIKAGGAIGEAARGVDCVLSLHFKKEEEYALPPLKLLPFLVSGGTPPDQIEAMEMASRLRSDLGKMLQEHKEIALALGILTESAREEGKVEYVRLAEKIMLHARTEEEVLYPASILVGEYLKRIG